MEERIILQFWEKDELGNFDWVDFSGFAVGSKWRDANIDHWTKNAPSCNRPWRVIKRSEELIASELVNPDFILKE